MSGIQQHKIDTSHGTISASVSAGSQGPALLMIHGNSSSQSIFKHVMTSPLSAKYKAISIDLPGHGDSTNAPRAQKSYTQKAYSEAALQVLQALNVTQVVVFGWSLGGHIAIELMQRCQHTPLRLIGILIVGTPPIPLGKPAMGFKGLETGALFAFNETLTTEEKDLFAHAGAGAPYEPWMRDAVERADGRARKIMFDAMVEGRDSDQKQLVETRSDVLVGVINGRDEPFINIEYISSLKFANLWKGQCFEMSGLKHAPFWEDPAGFQPYLDDFMAECANLAR